ncbi:hypothetical protein [Spirillospora albida]|uniref:hypothetical protein n=1 Tax=Spirillospora albida TaxID=58123 RepID=UPI00068B5C30|nr:hypothetical protein [Spirillospora albida]
MSILAALLATESGLPPDDTRALTVAAAIHDCRRRNDRTDSGHGHRAAAWLRAQGPGILAALDVVLDAPLLDRAAHAVGLHDGDQPDRDPLVGLLRAADALDRYRLPLARWWPDLSRLTVQVPTWMPPLAHRLVVLTEEARLDGATPETALTHAHHTILAEGTGHVG